MRPIRVMPPWLQNQIAAGEVVERPAAVVKELVENAIDAGATSIFVSYKDGGKTHIRVLDNGSGMAMDDALVSLERHATSKLETFEDLRNITTFGFRGEALPSIASVSRFTMRTRRAQDETGTQIVVNAQGEKEVTQTVMAPGTEITVDELFFNVPARRKFLRSDATEAQLITEVVQRFALMHHTVQFLLESGGRTVLSAPPEPDPMARIAQVFGKKVCDHLFECRAEGHVRVNGFISDPSMRRRGTGTLFLFVNSRFVRDKVVLQALKSGYGTLLPGGESPYAILDIAVPPSELDVNVHPTKAEVRFSNSGEVFAAVNRAVKLTLSQNPHVVKEVSAALGESEPSAGPVVGDTKQVLSHEQLSMNFGFRGPEQPAGSSTASGEPVRVFGAPPPGIQGAGPVFMDERRMGFDGPELPESAAEEPDGEATQASAVPQHAPERHHGMGLAGMRYLGQYANCFLLGQLGRKLVVVDQHAAHERVLFEQLRNEWSQRKVISQANLTPVLVDLEPRLLAAALAREEALAALGFRIELFGTRKLALHAAPAMFKGRSALPTLLELLDETPQDATLDQTDIFHKKLATIACHAAVRAGDPMDPAEVRRLFELMDGVDLAAFCPHGRPVVVFLEEVEVARWFKRT